MKKLIFTFILATLCGISAFAANNYDFSARCSSGQTLYYNITSSTEPYSVAVTYPNNLNSNYYYNFSKPTGNLTIPSSVTYSGITYSVTRIGENAFYGCSGLTSLTIPNSVTSIDYRAFWNCSGLTSITIPNSVTSIGQSAFYGCNSSYNQYDNAYYLGNVENQYLVLLKGVSSDITSCNISNDCKVIATSAFDSYSGLTSVTIGNSVTSIGQRAFYGCSGLTSLTIPNSVTSIDYRAFWNCSGLTSVTIGNSVESIGVEAFTNCSGLTSLTIPNSVTSIGNSAFSGCSGLTSVSIGNGVTSIGQRAFYGCSGLTSVTIPNSVTSIGEWAFYNCSGLTSLTIPNSVTSIGNRAFYDCSGLTSVSIGNGVTSIGQWAFYGCSGLEEMTIPFVGSSATATEASASTLFGYLFGEYSYTGGQSVTQNYSSSSNTAYYIPSSLRTVTVTGGKLNYGAFYGCSMLTTVTIGNSVTSIGESAFSGCSGLTSVTIGRAVTSIGESAFYNCYGLTSVYNSGTIDQWCRISFANPQSNPLYYAHNLYVDNSLVTNLDIQAATRIEQYAFYGATCLTSVTIGNSVTSIGNQAFCNCNGLTSVTIGNSVISIGESAFGRCNGLVEMTLPFVGSSATATEASASTLFGYLFGTSSYTGGQSITQYYYQGSSKTYYIPSSLRSVTLTGGNLLYGAFYGCSMLTSVTIGNGVTSIGNYAFSSCGGLTTVNFNATNCTYMGNYYYPVFSDCTSLATLNIGENVRNIPAYAFYRCSGLTSVTIPNSVTSIGESAFGACSGLVDITIPFVGSSATATTASESTLFGYIFGTTSYTGGTAVSQYYSSSRNNNYCIPSSLRSVTLTGGNLLYGAFYGCSMLTSVTIGNGVTSIGESAFSGCSGLTSVYNSGTIDQWCRISFANPKSNPLYYAHNLYVDNSLVTNLDIQAATRIEQYAFYGATCLTSVTIGNSVTGIGNDAFSGCSGLTDMTIPFVGSSATATESSASTCLGYLFGTTSYTGGQRVYQHTWSYYIPSSLRSVTLTGGNLLDGAFYGCSMLTSVTIGNGVTSIGYQAFCNCNGLTSVTIPNSVTSIGNYAFYGCSMLTSVTIGNGVTSIGEAAFYNCSGLTDIYANPATPPTLSSSSFYYYTATVWVPCGSLEAYRSATYWSNFSDIRESFPYTLNVSSADLTMGTASITQQDCIEGTVIIEANPNRGYAFSQWNDGNTDNPRTVAVTADVEYTASFVALSAYTITAESADETRGTVTGGGTYYGGETATLTATANDGYVFDSWADGSTDNPRTVTVTGNATYTATFKAWRTITVISADETQGTVSGGGTYLEDAEIEISATPAEHYHFAQWNDGNTDNPRTITITSDSTFTAVFAIDQHTVTVVSADTEMGTVSESGTYDYGTEIQISATPADGYGFVAWNDGNTDNPRTVIVTEDITYTATFGVLRTISVVSADETMGTVEGTGEYVEGATVQITAIPNEHYHFVHWIDEENQTRDFNTDNPRTITVTGNMTYTAVFAIDQHTITVESADASMGTVSEGGTYDYGTEMQISATASEHYHFVQWNDGNTDNPRTITVTEDATYRAEFAIDRFTITVESADEAMGTVSGSNTYDYGTEIQISASARDGYQFVSWDDGNTDNPRTITVVADATYIASFMSVVGIEENAVSEIALFPNPANDILNISSSETISEIEIVNTLGQVVKRIEVNSDNAVCDVEDLKAGVYVVRIHTEGAVVSQRKFIKE